MITNTAVRLAALCLLPAVALAEPSPARDALKRNCTGDYMEYCSAYAPGGPEVEACFKANIKNLSPGCASAIAAYKQDQKAPRCPARGCGAAG